MTIDLKTPEEVAEILKIKRATVYEQIKTGKMPAIKIGRQYRIDLNKLLDEKNFSSIPKKT